MLYRIRSHQKMWTKCTYLKVRFQVWNSLETWQNQGVWQEIFRFWHFLVKFQSVSHKLAGNIFENLYEFIIKNSIQNFWQEIFLVSAVAINTWISPGILNNVKSKWRLILTQKFENFVVHNHADLWKLATIIDFPPKIWIFNLYMVAFRDYFV